ncbi:hypothetical protein, partial [Viridibacillus arvi]|uniref:hypothetical protein n=1 Tax=Viridibacillus arvi TaxID=263475 RepID=UPI0034CF9A94
NSFEIRAIIAFFIELTCPVSLSAFFHNLYRDLLTYLILPRSTPEIVIVVLLITRSVSLQINKKHLNP